MSDAPWRCFVAVPLADELRARLADAVAAWRGQPELAAMRWAEPDAWHVTLAFLGPTEPDRVPALAAAIAAATAAHAPWTAGTNGVGAFPSASRARVAWYGVSDPDGRFARLAADVRAALAIEDAGRFRPHVTLARGGREPVDLRAWIAGASVPAGELVVTRVQLMRSHLGRGPARYETLATTTLRAPSRA
jgi:2'-5' RNA ligase